MQIKFPDVKRRRKKRRKRIKEKRWKRVKKGKTIEKYAYTTKNDCSI